MKRLSLRNSLFLLVVLATPMMLAMHKQKKGRCAKKVGVTPITRSNRADFVGKRTSAPQQKKTRQTSASRMNAFRERQRELQAQREQEKNRIVNVLVTRPVVHKIPPEVQQLLEEQELSDIQKAIDRSLQDQKKNLDQQEHKKLSQDLDDRIEKLIEQCNLANEYVLDQIQQFVQEIQEERELLQELRSRRNNASSATTSATTQPSDDEDDIQGQISSSKSYILEHREAVEELHRHYLEFSKKTAPVIKSADDSGLDVLEQLSAQAGECGICYMTEDDADGEHCELRKVTCCSKDVCTTCKKAWNGPCPFCQGDIFKEPNPLEKQEKKQLAKAIVQSKKLHNRQQERERAFAHEEQAQLDIVIKRSLQDVPAPAVYQDADIEEQIRKSIIDLKEQRASLSKLRIGRNSSSSESQHNKDELDEDIRDQILRAKQDLLQQRVSLEKLRSSYYEFQTRTSQGNVAENADFLSKITAGADDVCGICYGTESEVEEENSKFMKAPCCRKDVCNSCWNEWLDKGNMLCPFCRSEISK